jgi:serine protease
VFARTRVLLVALVTLALLGGARPASSSNDYYWSKLWGIRKVGADRAWATGTGRGATIAVVDTGVDASHEDLARNMVAGRDITSDDASSMDENGHGTHVAGIAAAVAGNGKGVAGVAPDAKIMPVRVLGPDGSGDGLDVDDGIRWAADHGAEVINLSLGDNVVIEDLSGGSMSDACNYAWSKSAICVVAAGNDKFFRTEFRQAKAIIVTATRDDDTKAAYATGAGFAPWGMAAPGGDTNDPPESAIVSTFWSKKGSKYAYEMGTSMAAPHVSGAVAVLRGLGLSPQDTVDRLLATAKDIGDTGDDLTFGHGRLDLARAVAGLRPSGGVQANGTPVGTAPPPGSSAAPAAGSGSSSGPRPATTPRPDGTPSRAAEGEASPRASAGFTPFAIGGPSSKERSGGSAWPLAAAGLGIVLTGAGAFGVWWLRRTP